MAIETRQYGEKFEVGLSGRLTSADQAAFRDLLSRMQQSGSKQFVLDLSNLAWIDSAGLGMLLLAKEAPTRKG